MSKEKKEKQFYCANCGLNLSLKDMGVFHLDMDYSLRYYCPLCRFSEFGFAEENTTKDYKSLYESNRFPILVRHSLKPVVKESPIADKEEFEEKRKIARRWMEMERAKRMRKLRKIDFL